MDFFANFMEHTKWKKFVWKSVNIRQTYERMYSGTVFIETRFIIFMSPARQHIVNHKYAVKKYKSKHTQTKILKL